MTPKRSFGYGVARGGGYSPTIDLNPSPEFVAEFIIGRRFAPTRWLQIRPLPIGEVTKLGASVQQLGVVGRLRRGLDGGRLERPAVRLGAAKPGARRCHHAVAPLHLHPLVSQPQ